MGDFLFHKLLWRTESENRHRTAASSQLQRPRRSGRKWSTSGRDRRQLWSRCCNRAAWLRLWYRRSRVRSRVRRRRNRWRDRHQRDRLRCSPSPLPLAPWLRARRAAALGTALCAQNDSLHRRCSQRLLRYRSRTRQMHGGGARSGPRPRTLSSPPSSPHLRCGCLRCRYLRCSSKPSPPPPPPPPPLRLSWQALQADGR